MQSKLPGTTRSKTTKVIWPGLRRWDIFEGRKQILPEVPYIGEFKLKNVVPDAHRSELHIGQFEIHMVYDGVRKLWLDAPENSFTMQRGFGIIIQEGQLHGGLGEAQHPDWHICIRFRIPDDNTAALPGISPRHTAKIRQTLEGLERPIFGFSRELSGSALRLLDEHRQRGIGLEAAARGCFLEFLAWLQRDLLRSQGVASNSEATTSPSAEIRNSLAYLEENIGTSFSIESMASAAELSPSQFRRTFHKEMGLSPHDYLARRRVELSKRILRAGKKSVTDVAMDMGFASAAHFALVFRRFVGMAPSQFREQCKTSSA